METGIGDYEDEATGCPHDGHPYFKGWFRTEDRKNNSECFMWQEVILKFIKKLWDADFNLLSGYFEIKIEELKDYVYREEIDCFIENKKK